MQARRIALCLALAAAACSGEKSPLKGDDVVLATVEGAPITEYDLQRAADTTLGHLGDVVLSRGGKDELLEGMVTGRALAVLRERELTPEQKAELDKRVAAFRERLLVEQYLEAHGKVAPQDEAELKAYYAAHPRKFGARDTRAFELVHGPLVDDEGKRVQLLAALGKLRDEKDWATSVAASERGPVPLKLMRGDVELANLHPTLRATALRLTPGQASSVTIVDGRAYVLRVTALDSTPARPFAEVRDEIASILAPRRKKQAISGLKDAAIKRVAVTYADASHTRKP